MPVIQESTDAIVRITKTTVTTPLLLKTVASEKLQPKQWIAHHFMLDQVMQAYDTFGNAMKDQVLKVTITNNSG